MTQDTFDDDSRDKEEKNYHLQSANSTLTTANQNIFSTPRVHAQNKASSQSNQIPVVTPPVINIPSYTIRPVGIPNKGANSNDHQVCIDMLKVNTDDTVDDMVPKKRSL